MRHGKNIFIRASAALVLGLILAGCAVVSAIDPGSYLNNAVVKDVSLASVIDGAYAGEYTLALPPGQYAINRHFSVRVTITGHAYAGVTIVEPSALASDSGFLGLIGRITTQNSLLVDGVSGATYSTRAMLKAVEAAVSR
jgi:uncharacterized protein with FMN-binding domain